jgi:protein phosphatase
MSRLQPPVHWTSAGATDRGQVRQINEDAYLDGPEQGLWAVADGMGGHAAGDLASRSVIQALATAPQQRFLGRGVAILQACLADANRRLCAEARQRGVSIIGSTVAALYAIRAHCVLLWVGDSRIYRLRRGILYRLSHDHSQVQDLVDQGLLAPEAAETYPAANIITRAVGADDMLQVDAQICEVKNGDRFLLCSDGLTKELSEAEIAELMGRVAVDALPRVLIDEACRRGARDNVTVVAVQFQTSDVVVAGR